MRLDVLRIQSSASCSQVPATKKVQAESSTAGPVWRSPRFFRGTLLSWVLTPIDACRTFVKIVDKLRSAKLFVRWSGNQRGVDVDGR